MIYLTIGGEVVKATLEHPFYTIDNGWIESKDLEVGNKIKLSSNIILIVEKIENFYLTSPCLVYNIEVEDYHTYFVSELEILVHNRCR